eukprot:7380330-Prymnesium_polylepis.6
MPGRFKQSYDADAQHPVSKQLPKFGVEHPPPRALLGNEGGGCDGGVSGGGGGSTSQRPGHNHSWPWSPHGVAAGKHWANAIPGRLRHTNLGVLAFCGHAGGDGGGGGAGIVLDQSASHSQSVPGPHVVVRGRHCACIRLTPEMQAQQNGRSERGEKSSHDCAGLAAIAYASGTQS